ncbi:pyridoxine/pyridoxamine 5'-phosphate oxidase [Parenemella sanctibonifatiensis]|uniref:Pyridoxamine 5'-phosphate oxidase n=1 Tax=Parenemella sanctibonifatiensis TaxID=2016505 RepID=A0A255EI12_9ACTN|nr:pyridoxamine 5'-phosphate oxidase family protein [Parenemella sanctibonifatiensis]OYN91164.1 pyridoxamine 5'-phosphate oxidase [Parenemella sanctibonifatiensis]
MTDLAARLRRLPAFPADMPDLDPSAAPDEPADLFLSWLEDAIASGARQPHAMTFQTNAEGPVGRTLILKDLDDRGLHVSTHRTSRKGQQLAVDPRAAMTFFWRESGRQVQVGGHVIGLDEETSQADWRARPSYTGEPNPDWQVYALQPHWWEFTQSRHDRRHVRIGYLREGTGWVHGPVTTAAG